MIREFFDAVAADIPTYSNTEFLVATVLISTIGLYAFYLMVKKHHITRLIENTPTSKIRSAAQGYVELNGKAKLMDGASIVSPISGRACVWYRYKIEKEVTHRDSKGNTTTSWQTIKSASSDELFLIEDETGRCIIDPDDADVVTTDKRIWYKNEFMQSRRYTEELIIESEPLYAIGLFKTVDRTETHKYKYHISELLRQWKKSPNLLLLKYDKDNNGELNEQEWRQVRLAAQKQVHRNYGQQALQEPLNLLKMTHNKDQAFILSTLSEQQLIKRYKIHLVGYILAFFIIGSFVAWAVSIRISS
ncbi:MAG: hypothetical protein COA83_09960 [Methylophaga sp.]|nr:MAG: hypothetical protein COA83_09960 [Methylophaga sp.]